MQTLTRDRIISWLQLIILASSLGWLVAPTYGESSAPGGHENEEAHGEESHISLTSEQIKHAGGGHPSTGPARPVNVMGYTDILVGPEAEFVSPNNDTFYMSLDADVTQEPLVLHVPNTNDRYYVLQFVDAWTNNFAI